jgi:uncharacterized membrane protein
MNSDAQPKFPATEALGSSQALRRSISEATMPETIQRPQAEAVVSARANAIVRVRPQWVWHRLNNPCNWAAFFDHLTVVSQSDFDLDEYAWSVLGVSCKVRLTVREPPLHLAWQSEPGAALSLSGEIILEPLEWQTALTVQLNYVTTDPRLSLVLQPLETELRRDVTRMARVLERPL